ncbi:MAG: hypothetical protein SFV23_12705 [Planctomycetaceae bacterium]|nr:hypothetical protein [Planctomycetaceae bacterium]
MSDLQDVADGVATALAAGSFVMPVTAVRVFDTQVDLPNLPAGGAILTVIGKSETTQMIDRGATLLDRFTVDCGIRGVPADQETTSLDPYSTLVDQIRDYFWAELWPGEVVDIDTAEVTVPWSVKHLNEQNVFLAVVSFTFVRTRDVPERP